jgi:hypothetical protein
MFTNNNPFMCALHLVLESIGYVAMQLNNVLSYFISGHGFHFVRFYVISSLGMGFILYKSAGVAGSTTAGPAQDSENKFHTHSVTFFRR